MLSGLRHCPWQIMRCLYYQVLTSSMRAYMIYNSSNFFPGRVIGANSGYDENREKKIFIRLYPFQYNPKENKLIVIKKCRIEINYGILPTIRKLSMSRSAAASSGFLWYHDLLTNNAY